MAIEMGVRTWQDFDEVKELFLLLGSSCRESLPVDSFVFYTQRSLPLLSTLFQFPFYERQESVLFG